MYSKIVIKGKLETVTGLHIGTGGAYSAIGAADLPVIRDVLDHQPMIPGSSLKGKLRTLLARKYAPHAKSPMQDTDEIKALFGSTEKRGRVLFSDLFLDRDRLETLRSMGIDSVCEVKFENTIDRLRAIANPRQIERVIRGCWFDLYIVCDVEDEAQLMKDMALLKEGMDLLQLDHLGGSGSRGYGRVRFRDMTCQGEGISAETLARCEALLKEVEQA